MGTNIKSSDFMDSFRITALTILQKLCFLTLKYTKLTLYTIQLIFKNEK